MDKHIPWQIGHSATAGCASLTHKPILLLTNSIVSSSIKSLTGTEPTCSRALHLARMSLKFKQRTQKWRSSTYIQFHIGTLADDLTILNTLKSRQQLWRLTYRKLGQEGAELAGHPATPSHCWAPQKKWTWWWKPAAAAHFPRSHRTPTPPTPVQGHYFQRYHSSSTSSLMNLNQSSQHSTQVVTLLLQDSTSIQDCGARTILRTTTADADAGWYWSLAMAMCISSR